MEIVSKSEKETYSFAKKIASCLKDGSILALIGDLGTGKTTFVTGLAKALKIEDHITSPTFVLMKQYDLENFKGKLSHIDCYRMQSSKDAEGIGVLELFQKNEGVIVLEWADKINEILPDRTVKIRFKTNDETKKISVRGLKCR